MIKVLDVMKVAKLDEVDDKLEELPEENGWDHIIITNTLTLCYIAYSSILPFTRFTLPSKFSPSKSETHSYIHRSNPLLTLIDSEDSS